MHANQVMKFANHLGWIHACVLEGRGYRNKKIRKTPKKTSPQSLKTLVYKLSRSAIYEPPCGQLTKNPPLSLHSKFLHRQDSYQEKPAPEEMKSALPPPKKKKPKYPPPPQNEEFYGHGGFAAERTQFFQAPIKLAQPFPAPEYSRTKILRTRGFSEIK